MQLKIEWFEQNQKLFFFVLNKICGNSSIDMALVAFRAAVHFGRFGFYDAVKPNFSCVLPLLALSKLKIWSDQVATAHALIFLGLISPLTKWKTKTTSWDSLAY